MKIRSGFVSNSSSSSFVINLSKLTEEQLDKLLHYQEQPRLHHDSWSIYIDSESGLLCGYTCMDNDDMEGFMGEIGLRMGIVKWDRG